MCGYIRWIHLIKSKDITYENDDGEHSEDMPQPAHIRRHSSSSFFPDKKLNTKNLFFSIKIVLDPTTLSTGQPSTLDQQRSFFQQMFLNTFLKNQKQILFLFLHRSCRQ